MSKTILITGASTGIGRETARYFAERGWNVAATMRDPSKVEGLTESDHLKFFTLDVENKHSIETAVSAVHKEFGTIDVLMNNAGYGAFGPLEAATDAEINRQFGVNVFGVIHMTQAVLPIMKAQKSGTIINVTSIGGLLTIPLFSLYHATKYAVEGLTETLSYELGQFGIDVKLIEPGGVETDFSGRSLAPFDISGFPEYHGFWKKIEAVMKNPERRKAYAKPIDVAIVAYECATGKRKELRNLVGKDAKQFWAAKRIFGYRFQMKQLRKYMGI